MNNKIKALYEDYIQYSFNNGYDNTVDYDTFKESVLKELFNKGKNEPEENDDGTKQDPDAGTRTTKENLTKDKDDIKNKAIETKNKIKEKATNGASFAKEKVTSGVNKISSFMNSRTKKNRK